MRPQQIVHDMCRYYLIDLQLHHPEIDKSIIDAALGANRARDIEKLSSISSTFDPACHRGLDLQALLQIEAFFKKNALFSEDDRCLTNARNTFFEGERQCRITNRRLDWYYTRPERLAPDLRFYTTRMEKWIESVLGDFDEFQEQIPELVRLTSGASASSPRRTSQPFRKLKRRYRCPADVGHYIRSLAAFFGYREPIIELAYENRVEVVPKNWKTFRTIACEPEASLPLQLAFDTWTKGRLMKFGINLRDQSLNQRLALVASTGAEIATIDLKNASGTIAFNVPAWFLPGPWFGFLSGLRSSSYTGPFGSGRYAMFSSMGNGATFTLETLVFAAACHAVGAKVRSVYGDDIIISADVVPKFLRLMRFLGFTVNQDKSHFSGKYHESCGTHWFDGRLITPSFIRQEHFSTKSGMCHLINSMASVAIPGGMLWKHLISLIGLWELPLVPYNERSDSGVWITPTLSRSLKILRSTRKKSMWISTYRAYVAKTRSLHVYDSRALFLWYHDAYRQHGDTTRERRRSTVDLPTHKFVRKSVCWFTPTRPLPHHLTWWSDDVQASLGT